LQKLFGTINCIRPMLGITTEELSPLFDLLKGGPDLPSLCQFTETSQQALQLVTKKIHTVFAGWHRLNVMIALFVIYSSFQPYALIGQWVTEHQVIIL
ncbi:POK18 protein, partial [Campylorhamphus procurvoides]|nr:POK18 protein [Campylorhamphus procurvoides]